jgi:hypothetical protein
MATGKTETTAQGPSAASRPEAACSAAAAPVRRPPQPREAEDARRL